MSVSRIKPLFPGSFLDHYGLLGICCVLLLACSQEEMPPIRGERDLSIEQASKDAGPIEKVKDITKPPTLEEKMARLTTRLAGKTCHSHHEALHADQQRDDDQYYAHAGLEKTLPIRYYIREDDFSASQQLQIKVAMQIWEHLLGKPLFAKVPETDAQTLKTLIPSNNGLLDTLLLNKILEFSMIKADTPMEVKTTFTFNPKEAKAAARQSYRNQHEMLNSGKKHFYPRLRGRYIF